MPRETVDAFETYGGRGKPKLGQVHVCWAESEGAAVKTAHTTWANAAIKGAATTELPQPAHFASLAEMITEEQVADEVVCGPDPQRHLDVIQEFARAGFDHVYIHQVGPDQAGFFDFYRREVMPELTPQPVGAAPPA